MSLYHMIRGHQPTVILLMPMLSKHPKEYPRFRDCFAGKMYQSEEKDEFGIPRWKHGTEELISVYTRVGGNNRPNHEKSIQEMRDMPEYVEDFDDDFDTTYAVFVFKVPEVFKKDFKCMLQKNNIKGVSQLYKDQCSVIFPKCKKQYEELFNQK